MKTFPLVPSYYHAAYANPYTPSTPSPVLPMTLRWRHLTDDRLAQLDDLITELNRIQHHQTPQTELMHRLQQQAIQPFKFPYRLFVSLSAFKQDVSQKRYQNFAELIDYCRRSANPVGRIMLHLFMANTINAALPKAMASAPPFSSSTFGKMSLSTGKKAELYLPQDDLVKFKSQRSTHRPCPSRPRFPTTDGLPMQTRL